MSFCNFCGAGSKGGFRFCPECGAPQFAFVAAGDSLWREPGAPGGMAPALYGPTPPKKISVAVLLALLFGPLGLLYSTVSGGLYMLAGWCFLALAGCEDWISDQLVVALIAWPICMAWAALAARSFNVDRR